MKNEKVLKIGNQFLDDLNNLMMKYEGKEDLKYMAACGLSSFTRNYINLEGVDTYRRFTKHVVDQHLKEMGL